jgi:hypothetical protein
MVRGYEKQSDSNTTTTSSSASASAVSAPDWDIAPPLQNVRVDTQYVGIIEEQKQQINSFRKNWLSSVASNIEHCQQMQAGGRMF